MGQHYNLALIIKWCLTSCVRTQLKSVITGACIMHKVYLSVVWLLCTVDGKQVNRLGLRGSEFQEDSDAVQGSV